MKVLNELADGPVGRAQEIQVPFLLQTSCVGSEKCPKSPAGDRQSWHRGRWGGQCQSCDQNQWEMPVPVGNSSMPPLA